MTTKKSPQKKYKSIALSKLETRFLLNLVLAESNELLTRENPRAMGERHPSDVNKSNAGSWEYYQERLKTLKNKIEKLDKSFYK